MPQKQSIVGKSNWIEWKICFQQPFPKGEKVRIGNRLPNETKLSVKIIIISC